jgi:hypothetical protein
VEYGADIIVAAPGRLVDFMERGKVLREGEGEGGGEEGGREDVCAVEYLPGHRFRFLFPLLPPSPLLLPCDGLAAEGMPSWSS